MPPSFSVRHVNESSLIYCSLSPIVSGKQKCVKSKNSKLDLKSRKTILDRFVYACETTPINEQVIYTSHKTSLIWWITNIGKQQQVEIIYVIIWSEIVFMQSVIT